MLIRLACGIYEEKTCLSVNLVSYNRAKICHTLLNVAVVAGLMEEEKSASH